MPRKLPKPEEIFYNSTVNIIKNMFTDANPNFKSYHYASTLSPFEFQAKVKMMAETVLEKIESWQHLLKLPAPEIKWKSHTKWFGLDHSTKIGTWKHYEFDIRYDYDGDPRKEPTNCGLSLVIWRAEIDGVPWEKKVKLESKLGKTIDELTKYSERWLEREYEAFLNG